MVRRGSISLRALSTQIVASSEASEVRGGGSQVEVPRPSLPLDEHRREPGLQIASVNLY